MWPGAWGGQLSLVIVADKLLAIIRNETINFPLLLQHQLPVWADTGG